MMKNNITTNPGIYIHVPYCQSKCNYCSFYSQPISGRAELEQYVDKMIEEIECWRIRVEGVPPRIFDTVYFGGGTPSILSPVSLQRILDKIHSSFNITEDAEITLEVNPWSISSKTGGENYLALIREMGFNRLSIGVQSFDDRTLSFLGRIHSAADAYRTIEAARAASFDNISLDLIYSIPYYRDGFDPMQAALSDIEEAIRIAPRHLSVYSLQIEPGTKMSRLTEMGLKPVSDELDREIHHNITSRLVEASFQHYEISSYALKSDDKDYRSRHNYKYWNMSEYLGIGDGASGFFSMERYTNPPLAERNPLAPEDFLSESIFLALRTSDGYRFTDEFTYENFQDIYQDQMPHFKSFVSSGHLILNKQYIKLSETGIDISNKIMALLV